MNFYVDSGGTILAVDPERIFQGSAMANTVRFIGAFPSNASVLISYTLPDGTKTIGQLMTFNKVLSGIVSESNGVKLSIWEQKIGVKYVTQDDGTIKAMPDYSVLEQAGKVEIHFSVVQSDNNGNPVTQTTAASSFICEKGTPLEMPSEAFDDYESLLNQILSQLSIIALDNSKILEKINDLDEKKVNKSGDTMTGPLKVQEGDFWTALYEDSIQVVNSESMQLTELRVGEIVNRSDDQETGTYNAYIQLPQESGVLVLESGLAKVECFLEQRIDFVEGFVESSTVLKTQVGVANGVAPLNESKIIPSEFLPSYVDDVVEYDSKNDFPKPGETGKIYVDKSTNQTYRWSGSTYIRIGGDLNIENGTGTGSIQQKGITYDQIILDFEPNMVAYVSYIGAGVSIPTSKQLIALLNSDKTNPYVAQILGNYTFEQYCVGFLAGTGSIQPGVSNKTAIDSLIAGALEGYGLTPSSDLSNTVGKVGSAAAILGAMNKAFSPGAFAGGVGCEAGDEGYPGNSICSFAYGSNVKNSGLAAIAAGKDLQNLGDTSAVFGSGDKEYKIEGSEVNKANQRIYLDNLASAGGTVTGTGDDRVGRTGINRGPNNFMAGTGHYIGELATNNAVVGNQNIISRSDSYSTTANNFISGLNNYINKSQLCGIIGAINKIENSAYTTLLGEGLKAKDADSGTAGVGRFNAINSNARFFVGNGTSDSNRKNAFEVLKDGRAKVQSTPTEENDVVRKLELDDLSKDIDNAISIAKGRATGYVFDTKSDLDAWLENPENVSNLVLGDNLYIRATDVPDYWWDGSSAQMLETQKVDLTDYVKKPGSSGIIRFNSADGTSSIQSTYQSAPAANQIPIAKNGGRITTNTPTDDLDCANKKYVDDSIAAAITTALNTEV